jgi:tight adherence protein C
VGAIDLSRLPLPILLLIGLFALAVGVGTYAVIAERQRRALIRRAAGTLDVPSVVRREARSAGARRVDWLAARVPAQLGTGTTTASQLVHAGWDGTLAPSIYALSRVVSALGIPLLVAAVVPRDDALLYPLSLVLAVSVGLLAPPAVLSRAVTARQEVIRRGIPDALDLLVVCVEAGVALDSAIQRVARELDLVHPVLATELLAMSRRLAAGMARDQAMQGLFLRTGVDELRSLASHMVQSEKWGTSIARVLRIYAEQLRKRRRMNAERRAATASTRMLVPLALFIFPTIFVVVLGPAAMRIMGMLGELNR